MENDKTNYGQSVTGVVIKKLIASAITDKEGLERTEFESKSHAPFSLYSLR